MPRLSYLRLTNFRNYAALDVEFSGAPIVLYGPNGAGKTNLLEALSLLSPGRGLRRARTEELALKDKGGVRRGWGIVADINGLADETQSDGVGPIKIAVGQVPEYPGRREVRINQMTARSAQLAEHLSLMWLTPAHDRLFTGPASERRKFLDRFALAHFPDHGAALLRYEKARSQRNRLLSDGIMDAPWFDALEADMAKNGARVEGNRVFTLARLKKKIDTHQTGPFPRADINLSSELSDLFGNESESSSLEEMMTDKLSEIFKAQRSADRSAGRTLRGIHKSDLIVGYYTKKMPAADCSTGEQKALLIGLTLAQMRALPKGLRLLLLDEVAAHLDEDRRAALIGELLALEAQIFMSGTDKNLFSALGDKAQIFYVKDGALKEEG